MKNMTSLMKVELILMKRQAAYYLLSIGLPSVFYLIFFRRDVKRHTNQCTSTISLFNDGFQYHV